MPNSPDPPGQLDRRWDHDEYVDLLLFTQELAEDATTAQDELSSRLTAVTTAHAAYRRVLEEAAARVPGWQAIADTSGSGRSPSRSRHVAVALTVLYWLAVVAVSLLIVIALVFLLESRDASSLNGS